MYNNEKPDCFRGSCLETRSEIECLRDFTEFPCDSNYCFFKLLPHRLSFPPFKGKLHQRAFVSCRYFMLRLKTILCFQRLHKTFSIFSTFSSYAYVILRNSFTLIDFPDWQNVLWCANVNETSFPLLFEVRMSIHV